MAAGREKSSPDRDGEGDSGSESDSVLMSARKKKAKKLSRKRSSLPSGSASVATRAAPFKYDRALPRSARDRKALKGVDCAECRAFYKDSHLTGTQLEAVLDRCSKHRAYYRPIRQDSPQGPWELTINVDSELEKTQPYEPLMTLEYRRQLREAEEAKRRKCE